MKQMASAMKAAGIPLPHCAFKNLYPTEEIAKRTANQCRAKRYWRLHAYYCEHCKGWHLTKQPQRKEIKR